MDEHEGLWPLFNRYEPITAPYSGRTPETLIASIEAAESVIPDLCRLEAMVYDAIPVRGATCDEIEVATGLSHQTASARMRGLTIKGAVQPNGEMRPTRSGRNAAVIVRVPNDETGRCRNSSSH